MYPNFYNYTYPYNLNMPMYPTNPNMAMYPANPNISMYPSNPNMEMYPTNHNMAMYPADLNMSMYPEEYQYPQAMEYSNYINPYSNSCTRQTELKDYGPNPFVININEATKQNENYRTALWTGSHFQLTLMSINPGEDIGLEIHPHTDQFLRIEDGEGLMVMGDSRNNLNFKERVSDDYAIMVPAGKWHNLINTGPKPLKVYSLYAPPQHPYGTVQQTKQIALAEKH